MQFNNTKIGYVLKKFPRLSETFILNELLELERQGFKISIFSLKNPYDYEENIVLHQSLKKLKAQVIYLPKKEIFRNSKIKILDLKHNTIREQNWESKIDDINNENNMHLVWASAIASICNSNQISHLHSHFGTASSVAMLAADLANISFSFTTHAKDIYKNDVNYNDLKLKVGKSRFVITVSDYNKNYLSKKFKAFDNKIIRLYNGIALNKFTKKTKKIKENIVVAVGRLEKKKGFEYLIESSNTLKNKGVNFKCLIVGQGKEHSNLDLLIKKYDLSKQVQLLGAKSQEQVIKLLSSSKVFVLPSIIDDSGDRDVLPTVLIEAMAMKVPVISTRVSAIPEIIENNKSGILIEQKRPDQLAGSIQKLLMDEELQNQFSSSGRKRVERLFDIEKNIPKLARLFKQSANNYNKNKIAV